MRAAHQVDTFSSTGAPLERALRDVRKRATDRVRMPAMSTALVSRRTVLAAHLASEREATTGPTCAERLRARARSERLIHRR